MEDGISRGLQHRHKTWCKKDGRHGRQACIVQRWFYHGDIVSGQVNLYMTCRKHSMPAPMSFHWLRTSIDRFLVSFSQFPLTLYFEYDRFLWT